MAIRQLFSGLDSKFKSLETVSSSSTKELVDCLKDIKLAIEMNSA